MTVPAITDKPLEDDRLIEVDWDGKVVWDWLASDHVDELGFSEEARQALRVDPNWGEERKSADWLHINAASYLGPNQRYDAGDRRFHPDNIMVSSREACIIAIIERRHRTHRVADGPDYRNPPALATLGQIVGQHHPHLIPKGLPWAGHLLVFDNGGMAGYGAPNPAAPTGRGNRTPINSRVLEVNPITFEKYGSTRSAADVSFFSHYVARAALPNGNTMVTEGWDGDLRADAPRGWCSRCGFRPVPSPTTRRSQPHPRPSSARYRLDTRTTRRSSVAHWPDRRHDVRVPGTTILTVTARCGRDFSSPLVQFHELLQRLGHLLHGRWPTGCQSSFSRRPPKRASDARSSRTDRPPKRTLDAWKRPTASRWTCADVEGGGPRSTVAT